MRSKVFLLTLKYIAKAFFFIGSITALLFLTIMVIGKLTGDPGLGFLVFTAFICVCTICGICYDMAKNKVNDDNRKLVNHLIGK